MVTVTPKASLADQPVHVVVRGLAPGQQVTIGLNSTDGKDVPWSSKAVFRSDSSGVVDLGTASAISGSYTGVNPMGLIEAMQPVTAQSVRYIWSLRLGLSFQVTVTENGATVAAGAFTRALSAAGVTLTDETIAGTGFYGQFWPPPAGTAPHPAVLEFGGSGGGLGGQLVGAGLASAGYPTLDIAYFGEPGLPSTLKDIPLEYFEKALRWLARQPGVLPHEIYVSGVSRGSEAALLLGVYYPNLVHGVIASSPDDVSRCSYPGCTGAAWTLNGKPLPYTTNLDTDPGSNPAVIPVQKIRGPVLFDCGTDDNVWFSCNHAQYSYNLAAGTPYPRVLYRYTGAGHDAGSLFPYQPVSSGLAASDAAGQGDTALANDDADARLWPELLGFLADPSAQTGVFTVDATPPPLSS
jgi:dienelactone hydrolase